MLGAILAPPAGAREGAVAPRGFTIQDGLKLNVFPTRTPFDLSPDGRWLAYTTRNHERQESAVGGYTRNGVPSAMVGGVVWVTDVRDGSTRCLTPGWGSSWAPRWSPDGKRLAFFSAKNGKPNLFVWNRETGRMRRFPSAVARPFFEFEVAKWSPDGRLVFYKALPEGAPLSFFPARSRQPGSSAEPFVELWGPQTEAAATQDDATSQKPPPAPQGLVQPIDVAVAVVDTGKVYRMMRDASVRSLDVSPDGRHLAVVGNFRQETPAGGQPNFDLYVVPVPAISRLPAIGPREWKPLLTGLRMGYGISISWAPDATRLAYTTYEGRDAGDVCLVAIADGKVRNLSQRMPDSPGSEPRRVTVDGEDLPLFSSDYEPPLWTPDGAQLLCVGAGDLWMLPTGEGTPRNLTRGRRPLVVSVVRPSEGFTAWMAQDGRAFAVVTLDPYQNRHGFALVRLDGSGVVQLMEDERFQVGDRTYRFSLDVAEHTGAVGFPAESPTAPTDLWMLEIPSRTVRQLTRVNPRLLAVRFGTPEPIEWETEDGEKARGILLLPPEATLETKAPLIAWVYPTRTASRGTSRFGLGKPPSIDHPALFTARGYAVLLPDVAIDGNEPLADITKAVVPALDAAIATGKVDGSRLGVFGHSSGGYAVNVLITQTDRFKAAVSCQGYAHLTSFYLGGGSAGVSVKSWIERVLMGSTPWEERDRYTRNSPVFSLHRVETPLLLIYGENDPGFPEQAWEMYRGLTRLGKPVALAGYKNADHYYGTWSTEQIVDFWDRVLGWFDKHLKGAER